MNSKHTPGPWVMSGMKYGYSISPCGIYIGRTYEMRESEQEANARLISAAPELLAALEGLLASAQEAGWHHDNSPMRNARAAIAKAKNSS